MAVRKTTKKTPAPAKNISDMIPELSLEDLVSLKSEVESLIKDRQKEKKKDILKQMDELAQAGGFSSATELIENQKKRGPRSDKGVRLPPKYQSQDGKKTWSGKGRVPRWVLEHEADGGNREELLIK